MAQLSITPNTTPTLSGWSVGSNSAAALAAIPDAIIQRLGITHDALTLWALHPSEQDGLRESAYLNERAELGMYAQCEIMEMARPHRQNVVWIDRFHLVATGAQATCASRIAGLYTGGEGILVIWVHDPSVTTQLAHHARSMPPINGAGWDNNEAALSCRFTLMIDGRRPGVAELRCPPLFAPGIGDALQHLSQLVASW